MWVKKNMSIFNANINLLVVNIFKNWKKIFANVEGSGLRFSHIFGGKSNQLKM